MSQRRYAGGAPSYNEPSGHLFGEKPPPKGQKREKQAWENMWYIGMYGGMVAFGVLYYFKPDRSVRHWATPEAEKRLNESGVPWRYKPSPYSGYPEGIPDEKK
ncbi:hypothetical protein MVES1_000558 [Malassezia vespertilionis]|uniref:uncharacterized protein n=1 Tax=Malassezia vespertilionis TaxID=2020962 RepID=UPI0024B15D27|nr:uncharacterized protein MVES1_000558 [Malassezia vespertilionis]WFD05230.1 hypothetical protein MVES1_000558 [Malassezia vespertilionis]